MGRGLSTINLSAQVGVTPISPLVSNHLDDRSVGCSPGSYGWKSKMFFWQGVAAMVQCPAWRRCGFEVFGCLEFGCHKTFFTLIPKNHQQKGFIQWDLTGFNGMQWDLIVKYGGIKIRDFSGDTKPTLIRRKGIRRAWFAVAASVEYGFEIGWSKINSLHDWDPVVYIVITAV